MVSIIYSGRLGNNLFQYSAAYIFAKKFGLNLNTNIDNNLFELPKTEGKIVEINTINVTDNNYIELLEKKNIEDSHYQFVGYYQIKDFILKYEKEIKSLFTLKYDNTSKESVFVCYRIGDINNSRQMLPIEYYQKALKKLKCKKGVITSDTIDHPNIKKLSDEFNLEIFNDTPINTLNYGKNFNNLVLSEGSFSWWIGFLSNAKNIYYNSRERFWHGDMFVFPNWTSLEFDWDKSCYGNDNILRCNKIINN